MFKDRKYRKELEEKDRKIDELSIYIKNKEYEYLCKCDKLERQNEKLKEDITYLGSLNEALERIVEEREKEIRRINGAKGGLKKELNKIKSQIKKNE